MQTLHPFRAAGLTPRSDERLQESAIERKIDLGDPRGGREAALVLGVIAAQRANVVERARLAAHDPVAGTRSALAASPISPRRSPRKGRAAEIDQVDVAGEFVMLFPGDAAETKMPRCPTVSCTV